MDYSILMSVYYKEKPEYLKQAIESMLNQTIKSNDFVIVCDGQLTQELYKVLDYYESDPLNYIHRLQLDKNYGLGIALSKGLKVCKNEIVARMDSDDISLKNRCEEQIKKIKSGYDLVGSWVDEFDDDCNFVSNIRTVPESYTEIKQFAKKRNPFNHPSVMFKKKAVISVGGYKDLLRLEDYYLWVRMIKNGNKMINIQKVLLHMRVNKDAYLRRNTYKSLESFFYLRNYQKRSQMISQSEKIILDFLQIILTLLPKKCLKFIYELVLRK